ncbi:hypothetical protein FOQG_17839 [Fusarium oxysporum f. sp. raphani 54005]|uniref:PD-(D/E)XK nuclease-like domain-containing protein n=1 Tax=Fusarium oxysporum f. sp. raphani 54005 TaxID=1089458 RepID=X0C3V7_FUSOX|nr:hypothetical protein FOQG_17839 [Fusarium oxysporum f. sp. raphani 54005]
MSLEHRINSWLQQIKTASKSTHQAKPACDTKSSDSEHCSKRRRLNPPTPDASRSGDSHSMASNRRHHSPSKRSHDETQAGDDDEFQTPRPPKRKLETPRSESGTSLSSTQSLSQVSERSGYSSPTKQLRALELHTRGVIAGELSAFRHKPPSLEALLDQIDLALSGFGLLPSSQRSTLDQLDEETYSNFKWTKQPVLSNFLFSEQRDQLGETPPPEIVHRILHQAAYCNSKSCSEADWNMEVHHRVLEAALRPLQGCQMSQLFDFRLSTTASIIAEYHVTSASKKVDFCMYIDPKCDETTQVSQIIHMLRNILPLGMFNHTNLSPLSDNPIAVSIETKKTGEGWENAKLQMEIWMAAHWQFLRKLLGLRQRAANELSSMKQAEGVIAPNSEADKVWQLPKFMPCIIIQGHDWHLIITTPEGEKTTFWQKQSFGDTWSSKGIYKIIYNLQLLRKWAQEEYWTWLRELLLEWPRYKGELVVV